MKPGNLALRTAAIVTMIAAAGFFVAGTIFFVSVTPRPATPVPPEPVPPVAVQQPHKRIQIPPTTYNLGDVLGVNRGPVMSSSHVELVNGQSFLVQDFVYADGSKSTSRGLMGTRVTGKGSSLGHTTNLRDRDRAMVQRLAEMMPPRTNQPTVINGLPVQFNKAWKPYDEQPR